MFKLVQRSIVNVSQYSQGVKRFSGATTKKASIPEPSMGISVAVNAFYIARGIDYLKFNTTVSNNIYSGLRQEYQPKSMTITIDESQNQYVTIFKYGSVVLFNIPEEQHLQHLRQINEVATIPIAEGLQHKEKYKVIVHENLEKPSVIKAEHLNIRALDANNLTIVSTIMAQTVALDYHAVAVDKMVASFTQMNMKVKETGDFQALSSKELHKLVASNNTVITNVLSELGIFEGTEAAWENADYYYTWEAVRKDFEVDQRFKDLSLKINLIKDDARFFLEVLQNQKSTKLEWIIIILIAGEMIVGLAGLYQGAH